MFDPHRRRALAPENIDPAFLPGTATARPQLEVVPKRILDTHSLSVTDVITAICDDGYHHVVQKDGLLYEEELAAADRMILAPELYFNDPVSTIFGGNAGGATTSFRLTLDASERKHRLLEELTNLLTTIKGSKRILVQALAIADELYTNASKNSWNPGDRLYEDPVRRAGEIEFIAAADGQRLLLCCRDSFGALSMPQLLKRLRLCGKNGIANSISTSSSGAGIGAFLTFDSSVSYYAGVQGGRATVVCAALPLGMSGAVYGELPKNIHIII